MAAPKRSSKTGVGESHRRGKSLSLSGAAGGPSTYRGTSFQANYAVYRALELIVQGLCTPTIPLVVGMEPRALAAGDTTEWDVVFGPPTVIAEVKLQPTRSEILDWLTRVRDADIGSVDDRRYQLVYSRGGGGLLKPLSALIDNAKAAATAGHFDRLVESGRANPDVAEILEVLGEQAHGFLQRAELIQLPSQILEELNVLKAKGLVGETPGRNMVSLLFQKFSKGAATRLTFPVHLLIQELEETGVTLPRPTSTEVKGVSPQAEAALVILQACESGIPLSVVASAVAATEADLKRELEPMVMDGIIVTDGLLWSMVPLTSQLNPPNAQAMLASALESLLAFIEHQYMSASARVQILNTIALAKRCRDSHPSLVARVFQTLDKRLKDLGDKHLVFDVAELSIAAARRVPAPRSPQVRQAEAHALICGRSWVYQRVGRLDEAHVAAEKSLHIGEDIGWDRNSAYCHKCIGRLCRLEAEAANGADQEQLLTASVNWLTRAIERFNAAGEFGPTHPEVGDCYSLLGRTYLAMGRMSDAQQAITTAHELIPRGSSKDYIDLLILGGDWELRRRNWRASLARYDDALEFLTGEGAEVSEMRARALVQRALAKKELGEKPAPIEDLRHAADIYQGLGEAAGSAEAHWKAMILSGEVSDHVVSLLDGERATVRVTTIRLHTERVVALKRPLARRSEPGRPYWDQLIIEARRRVAAEDQEW